MSKENWELRKIENFTLKCSREVIARGIVEKSKKLRKIKNSMLKISQGVIVKLCRRIVDKLS